MSASLLIYRHDLAVLCLPSRYEMRSQIGLEPAGGGEFLAAKLAELRKH